MTTTNKPTYVKSETAKVAETLQAQQIDHISIFGPNVGCPFDPDITVGAADMEVAVSSPVAIEHLLWDLRQSKELVGNFAVPGCFVDTVRFHFKPDAEGTRLPLTWKFNAGNVHYCFSPEFYNDLQILIQEKKQRLHAH